MKRIQLLLTCILSLYFSSVSGQIVDIGIFPSGTPNQLEIRIRPSFSENNTRYITNAQFTVKWPISSGIPAINTGALIFPFYFQPQGSPLADGGYYYLRYVSNGGFLLKWSANSVIVAMSFTAPPCAQFEIADDEFVHRERVNGAYYFEINGIKTLTGSIYQPTATPTCLALHYRSTGSGDWTDPSYWETSANGTSYGVAANTYPTSSDLTIKVQNSHTLTINENISVDQFTIEAGGEVTVPTGVTLTNAGAVSQFVIKSSSEQSGSLLTVGSGQVTNPITYERSLRTDDWHYFSSPLGSLTSDPGNITQIYAWDEPSGNWTPFSGYNFTSGQGYNLDQIGSGVLSFTGSVVYSASVTATSPYTTNFNLGTLAEYNTRIARTPFGGGGWNLLGNPFTSAMSVSGFLEANDGDGTVATDKFDPNYVAVYIYDGDLNQYFYRGKTTGFADPVTDESPANAMFDYDNIQAGQGFFVLAQKNGVSFSFDKTMQTHSTSVPLKSADIENSWPGLKLKVKSGNNENSTLIVFNDRMTTGLDPGYDVGQLSAGPDVEIYTALVKDNGVNFSQQALPLAGNEKNIVPVGVDCEKGANVTFSAYLVPIGNGTFYLEDKVTGKFTDLSKESYSVTLPAKTTGTGRFFIHTSLVTGIAPQIASSDELNFRIWTSHNKLNIEGAVSSKATGAIYDMLGRIIFETRLNNATLNTITVPAEITGIYLVKITDGNKVAIKKVVF